MPAVGYSSDEGFGYGGCLSIYQYKDYDPYYYNIYIEIYHTTKNIDEHIIQFDWIEFFHTPYRFIWRIDYEKTGINNYFGVGNSSVYNKSILNHDEDYYYYKARRISSLFLFQRSILEKAQYKLRAYSGINCSWNKITPYQDSILFQDESYGIEGGDHYNLKTGVVFDSRDNEFVSHKGIFSELGYAYTPDLSFNDYSFHRYTLINRIYFPVLSWWIIAHRIVWDIVDKAPFYEKGYIGGITSLKGLGGADTLRGYLLYRYIDKVKVFMNLEFRIKLISFILAENQWNINCVLFTDTGRVWPEVSAMNLIEFHYTYGSGLRFEWGRDFIIAFDYGISKEGEGFYTYFGYSF